MYVALLIYLLHAYVLLCTWHHIYICMHYTRYTQGTDRYCMHTNYCMHMCYYVRGIIYIYVCITQGIHKALIAIAYILITDYLVYVSRCFFCSAAGQKILIIARILNSIQHIAPSNLKHTRRWCRGMYNEIFFG